MSPGRDTSRRQALRRSLAAPLAVVLALALAPLHAQPADAPQTLSMTLAGTTVDVDVYRPAGVPRGAVILAHGFTRSRTTLGAHAAALAAEGALALTPDLPSTFDFRRNARGLGELVLRLRAGDDDLPAVSRVVLVGFSAGALSSLLAAGTSGVVGYVGLDPFDRVEAGGAGALGRDFAPTLTTEAILLRAPPSRCNAESVAAPWGRLLPALVSDRVIEGASHCDFESPTDWLCSLACGPSDPARQALVRSTLQDAVERWLPRPRQTAGRR
jgi:dienelactone hydrolase